MIAALRPAADRLDVIRDLDARDVHVLSEHVADEARRVLGCSAAAASDVTHALHDLERLQRHGRRLERFRSGTPHGRLHDTACQRR
jgi:hypothetical protein